MAVDKTIITFIHVKSFGLKIKKLNDRKQEIEEAVITEISL